MNTIPLDIVYNNIFPYLENYIRLELDCFVPVRLPTSRRHISHIVISNCYGYAPKTFYGPCWYSYFKNIKCDDSLDNIEYISKQIYEDYIMYRIFSHNGIGPEFYYINWCSNCHRVIDSNWYCKCESDICTNFCNCMYCNPEFTSSDNTSIDNLSN